MSYQTGEFLEVCKDRLLSGCKVIIEKIGWIKQEEKSDLSGLVDYKQVSMLSSKKQVNSNTQFQET